MCAGHSCHAGLAVVPCYHFALIYRPYPPPFLSPQERLPECPSTSATRWGIPNDPLRPRSNPRLGTPRRRHPTSLCHLHPHPTLSLLPHDHEVVRTLRRNPPPLYSRRRQAHRELPPPLRTPQVQPPHRPPRTINRESLLLPP